MIELEGLECTTPVLEKSIPVTKTSDAIEQEKNAIAAQVFAHGDCALFHLSGATCGRTNTWTYNADKKGFDVYWEAYNYKDINIFKESEREEKLKSIPQLRLKLS
jgi:hypothetical protein